MTVTVVVVPSETTFDAAATTDEFVRSGAPTEMVGP